MGSMTLILLAMIGIFGLFVLVYGEMRVARATDEKKHSVGQQTAEVHTVATMAATLMAGMLANPKRYEELMGLEDRRVDHVLRQNHEMVEAAQESREPAEWVVDDSMLRITEESIRGGSVFSFEGRKKVLKLAWSTLEEVRACWENVKEILGKK